MTLSMSPYSRASWAVMKLSRSVSRWMTAEEAKEYGLVDKVIYKR